MVEQQLICTSVICPSLQAGVTVNFKCPEDGYTWQTIIPLPNAPESGDYDFNNKVTYTIPEHGGCSKSGAQGELFLAVHQDSNGLKMCVQRADAEGAGGIPSNWWSMPQQQ